MPDLQSQIGLLYRVISQTGPASDSGCIRNSHLRELERRRMLGSSFPRRGALMNPGRWICTFYCLWFSLPLSIWLSSGWFGLLFYWQALSGAACLLGKLTGKQELALPAMEAREGDASC
jgi:hypothetical protein